MTFVEAGGDVSIVTLDRGDEPPPPLPDAAINSKGAQRIGIPREGDVALGGKETLPLNLTSGPEVSLVDLRSEKSTPG